MWLVQQFVSLFLHQFAASNYPRSVSDTALFLSCTAVTQISGNYQVQWETMGSCGQPLISVAFRFWLLRRITSPELTWLRKEIITDEVFGMTHLIAFWLIHNSFLSVHMHTNENTLELSDLSEIKAEWHNLGSWLVGQSTPTFFSKLVFFAHVWWNCICANRQLNVERFRSTKRYIYHTNICILLFPIWKLCVCDVDARMVLKKIKCVSCVDKLQCSFQLNLGGGRVRGAGRGFDIVMTTEKKIKPCWNLFTSERQSVIWTDERPASERNELDIYWRCWVKECVRSVFSLRRC